MPYTNELLLVDNQGWDERILVCRNGRMVDAITAIGPGVLAEAFPFRLGLQGH